MNASAKNLIIALLVAALPLAAPASHAQDSLTVACARPQLPSQEAVGTLLGLSNFGQVYAARDRLMQEVHRACRKGPGQIIVRSDASSPQATRWSQADTRAAMVPSTTRARARH